MKFCRRLQTGFLCFLLSVTSGCGYTRHNSLPQNYKSIYVKTVLNKIPINQLIAYKPGLEIDITNAVVRRLQRDGNLKVARRPEDADLVWEADLVHFDQEGVRFSRLDTTQELRIYLILSMRLIERASGQTLWEEQNFTGDEDYFISQIRDQARDEAADHAVDRLARNVVDRIVEDW